MSDLSIVAQPMNPGPSVSLANTGLPMGALGSLAAQGSIRKDVRYQMNAILTPRSIAILLAASVPLQAQTDHDFCIATDFPGGSAEVLGVDRSTATVQIQPAVHWEQGFPCWWYLRISGLAVGQKFTFKVTANPRPYRRQTVLSRSWSQPGRAAISTDNVTWGQTGKYRLQEDGTAVYEIDVPAERIWLAWGPPFLPSHTEALFESVTSECSSAARFTLARTRGDRPVPAIRIGGGTPEQPAKYGVWVQGCDSTPGRPAPVGLRKGFSNGSPATIRLRKNSAAWPPFGSYRSWTSTESRWRRRKDSIPRDHNRDWDDNPIYPAVSAAQSRLAELHQAGRLDFFLDIHNPGDDKLLHYFFGPNQWQVLPQRSKRNHTRWLELANRAIVDPLPLEPEYKTINYVQTEEESNRISVNWVRNHTDPHVVATTFEAASNTPHSTQEGYQAVGQQLAEALAEYLREDPATTGRAIDLCAVNQPSGASDSR